MGLFTKALSHIPSSYSVVIDDDARFVIDNDYRELGEREGWLIKTGHYRDAKGRFVWTYIHYTGPP